MSTILLPTLATRSGEGRRRGLLPLAPLVLVLLVPTAAGFHLSVGVSDSIGVQPEETPRDASVDGEPYEIGTRDPATCYQPDPEAPNRTLAEIQAARDHEGFCGELYDEPGTVFGRPSPRDQDLHGDVGTFDATIVTYVGNHQLQTCTPWCEPAAEGSYEAAHALGAEVGLAPTADETDHNWQEYAVNLAVPNPTVAGGEELGTHPMNGWVFPVYDQTFVAFLFDEQGDPIDERDLAASVAERAHGLPAGAVPEVCGFTPDANVRPMAPTTSFCEIEFRWIGADGTTGRSPCNSRTYLCGAFSPHWQAEVTCAFALANCGTPTTEADRSDTEENDEEGDEVQSGDDPDEPRDRRARNSDPPASADSTLDHVRWHFVVAPRQSACNGLVDPGFLTDAPPSGAVPYLAHDLDVYTPLADVDGAPIQGDFANLHDWGQAHADQLTGTSEAERPDADRAGRNLGLGLQDVRRNVAKSDLTEPNTPHDTSQSRIEIDRDNVCTSVTSTPETRHTRDPWVDVVDNHVVQTGANVDGYGNERDDQDASNRPGPGWYTTQGMVGVFTDPDDDGNYEQAPADAVFTEIFEHGAYPMFWDMHLDGDADPAPAAGCTRGGEPLVEMMGNAGYGSRTGLVQLVLLHEGADWNLRDGPMLDHENIVGLHGDWSSTRPNAYLFMSQGLWQLERGDPVVDGIVAELRELLPAAEHDLVRSIEMHDPGDEGRSDFYGQCGEPTGGFTSRWDFSHHCSDEAANGCEGDTVVTAYLYETTTGGEIGGDAIPAFRPTGPEAFDGFEGEVWVDVDPLDNDPDRNTREGSPPTGEQG